MSAAVAQVAAERALNRAEDQTPFRLSPLIAIDQVRSYLRPRMPRRAVGSST
jgi:hypothetical protein